MKRRHDLALALALLALALPAASSADEPTTNTRPQMSWHWHMHQPIYWNARQETGVDRYEYAWDSIQANDAGRTYPLSDLREIFGKDDRVAAYQWGPRNSIDSIRWHPTAGVAVSYTGALMENVNSLGQANQLGYGSNWRSHWQEAHGWETAGGNPRMDMVIMSFHHAMLPLHNEETVYMELRLMQEKISREFGEDFLSRGFFPTEMAFSVRLIPVLEELGLEWAIVSGEKIARATPDFPIVIGSGGINNDLPNRADQRNPEGEAFVARSISRGVTPRNANPMSYQAAYTRYVHPETGEEHRVIAVPADQAIGWEDGSQCIGAGFFEELEDRNDPNQPSLVLMVHDGDNFFGGGFSYYNECVPNLTSDANNRGNPVTTIEEYLQNFPPDPERVIHVEDGAWVNADPDFGSPTFITWNYPPVNSSGQVDPVNGWNEKMRDWAIFTASLNHVLTAEQIARDAEGYEPDFEQILYPSNETHPVDRGWHYHLGSLDSGNVYYGQILDFPIKAQIGINEVARLVDPVIGDGSEDRTPPTIWLPQRHPYNPGGRNFGVQYGYQEYFDDGDFHVFTHIHDVSGVEEATLYYRIMDERDIPIDAVAPFTYAGGDGVGEWMGLDMTLRSTPKEFNFANPDLNSFPLPAHIADYYWVEVTDLRDVTINYYVEAVDTRGNVARSPIQHVYIGDGEGATDPGGPDGRVRTEPSPLIRGENGTIVYSPEGGPLSEAPQVYIHYGRNGWTNIVSPDPAMTLNAEDEWEHTFFVAEDTMEVNLVFNNGAGTWDNNNGQDWHFQTVEAPEPIEHGDHFVIHGVED